MTSRLTIRIYEQQQLRHTAEFEGPLTLGRQDKDRGEPLPFQRLASRDGARLIIAPWEANDVSRRHVTVEPLPSGKVRLSGQSIQLAGSGQLTIGTACELALPAVFALGKEGRLTVRLQEAPRNLLNSLPAATLAPGVRPGSSVRFLTPPVLGGSINTREVIQWLSIATDVLQAAADSADFFERAAAAAADLVGLDLAQVLLLVGDEWKAQARKSARGDSPSDRTPSRQVLAHLREEKRTFWEELKPDAVLQGSLVGVDAVVAAPILDRRGGVLGALYGERRHAGTAAWRPINEVEAMLVELLARGVAAGLARLEQEKAALAERVRFEQFFTPDLARQLTQNPDLLQAREAEVSVLFCDIRGFSRISERLGAARSFEWCRDVLDMLSACVLAECGVLVDYIGDGLMAMWGAPGEQPDHARRACRAALAMLAGLPQLTARWQETLQEPVSLGIGINTGQAQVGNTGSQVKFKYGARGPTVNLASRIEGATKHLRTPLLIAAATQAQLDAGVLTRRLGKVQVRGIEEPAELYEPATPERADWPAAKAEYEKALGCFEGGDFGAAARTLGIWLAQHPEDGPALELLARAVRCRTDGVPPLHPVWVLPGK
jgi:adenylate cyclase